MADIARLVRKRQGRLQASFGSRPKACQSLATTRLAAPPTEQQLYQSRSSNRVFGAVRELRYVVWSGVSMPGLSILQTTQMPKAGISWAAATWHSRNFPKHMKLTNKPSIAMGEIRPSGAPSESSTTRSISIVMHLTPILAPYV